MAFATYTADATFLSRIAADVIYPAAFVYVDWPTGAIRATTHTQSVVIGANTWSGVGNIGFIEADEASDEPVARRMTVGLNNLWMSSANTGTENSALGVDAEVYLGLFDANWENPVLDLVFGGFVNHAGRVRISPADNGYLVDAALEFADQFNPRRGVTYYHAVGSNGADSAQKLLHYVMKEYAWPA